MKIAWYSNAPWGPTGYGTQTAQMSRRLVADGHDLTILANWGQQIGMGEWEGIPILPQGLQPYSLDVIDEQVENIDPDWVITLYDTWVLIDKPIWKDRRVASWVPVDHYPPPPKVIEWCRRVNVIAMSRFGESALADAGISSTYIPHGIEKVFRPVESDLRSRMNVPDDAFLVTINQANIGNAPPRKAWDQNIQAMADLMRNNKDVYLYLHTDLRRPGGVPIDGIAQMWGMPMDRVRICDQTAYRLGVIDTEELNRIYSASDVMLAATMGEGFGLTPAEAGRAGCPSIVTNFSAQPEVAGPHGWKVGFQMFYDQGQHAALAMPLVKSIRDALQEAYEERGTDKARQRRGGVREYTEQFDADVVFDTMWKPMLAKMNAQSSKVIQMKPGYLSMNRKERRRK